MEDFLKGFVDFENDFLPDNLKITCIEGQWFWSFDDIESTDYYNQSFNSEIDALCHFVNYCLQERCPNCSGSGEVYDHGDFRRCDWCHGTGWVLKSKAEEWKKKVDPSVNPVFKTLELKQDSQGAWLFLLELLTEDGEGIGVYDSVSIAKYSILAKNNQIIDAKNWI